MPDIMDQAREQARKFGTGFEVVDDMDEAFRGADIIYAKSWGAMVHTQDEKQGADIIKKYSSWITDERRMKLAKEDAIYMHPLPADRNVEVTDGVIDSAQSVVYDEAENRLHAQKAVMALTMG
jgi:N-acetylornithine carbamoyltransferase